nr:MAG: hypothetical protein DIU78_02655 [Pseudomonadota bacterium]
MPVNAVIIAREEREPECRCVCIVTFRKWSWKARIVPKNGTMKSLLPDHLPRVHAAPRVVSSSGRATHRCASFTTGTPVRVIRWSPETYVRANWHSSVSSHSAASRRLHVVRGR